MVVSVPATSANLGPGFDCLGLGLALKNRFSVVPAAFTSIRIQGEGEGFSKFLVDNIFVKIFKETLAQRGIKENFEFSFYNSIPISRGLGSSSAIIVGALSAAHHYLHNHLNKEEILDASLVYEAHPDNVTPAVFGGFNVAMVEKVGGRLKAYHLRTKIPDYLKAVVVIPTHSISTKFARQALPKRYNSADAIYNLSRSSLMAMVFMQEKWELLRLVSKDRLHQDRRMRLYPVLYGVQKLALENGALMSTLSGSGSSFFNLCYTEDAPNLQARLQKKYYNFKVVVLDFDNEGVQVED
ncbi:homoserine kinase [Helicobacter ailurogastricus]|uniref:Homoserine kinase n=1 Tax=Helicobacter ailurogastricus TaxID=1578720 RepID=A0A0K2XCJ0_9HELI|nr:homoserine kinase [Helicobacter ailurogastricus]GMB90643.1 Homoserine kinase ThrB [Helicobacter ailurogastricus]CRF42419.1 Homoserine kinase [Helicobacter ailurogastricus]CRF44640.1 Homoserine kinase [Helicobacter ailurogastricus]